jgi:hypothetical protein
MSELAEADISPTEADSHFDPISDIGIIVLGDAWPRGTGH